MKKTSFLGTFNVLVALALARKNNVCKTFLDYATKEVNPNCWYNPDVGAPPGDIINRRGFPFEAYPVVTEDGYVLNLFRIPHNNSDIVRKRQPVYLFHGISLNANVWFDHGPRSLAYALSNNGYDVWMANIRGNRYSNTHLKYTTRDKQFWNFSWEDAAYYDVPASLQFIKKRTGQKAIYIGHSMGITIASVFASVRKEQAKELLKGIISLSGVCYLTGSVTSAALLTPFRNILEIVFAYGLYKYPLLHQIANRFICDTYPGIYACYGLTLSFSGFPDRGLLAEEIPVLYSTFLDGLSINTYTHYLQETANGGNFQRYDYGPVKNLVAYHSRKSPDFNVTDIDLCVHMFYGKNDFIVRPNIVERLHREIRCSTKQKIESDQGDPYTHFDFIYGSNVEKSLYPPLFRRIKELELKN